MSANTGEIPSQNHSYRKLRSEVLVSRLRWQKDVEANVIKQYSTKGIGKRSQLKTIYICCSGAWSDKLLKDVQRLQSKVSLFEKLKLKGFRDLWIPSVVDNVDHIELDVYRAVSTRQVELAEARSFARKAGLVGTLTSEDKDKNKKSYVIKAITGRDYRLKCFNEKGLNILIFTDWIVCLYNKSTSIPIFQENDLSRNSGAHFDGALCVFKNSALFSQVSAARSDAAADDDDEKDFDEYDEEEDED